MIIVDPDVGRRVLQCPTCERVRGWTGRQHAIEAGWAPQTRDGKRDWYCPTCWVPAALAPAPVLTGLLPDVVVLVRLELRCPKRRARSALQDLLLRYRDEQPARFFATLTAIDELLRRKRSLAAAEWRAFVLDHAPSKKRGVKKTRPARQTRAAA